MIYVSTFGLFRGVVVTVDEDTDIRTYIFGLLFRLLDFFGQ